MLQNADGVRLLGFLLLLFVSLFYSVETLPLLVWCRAGGNWGKQQGAEDTNQLTGNVTAAQNFILLCLKQVQDIT